MPANVRHLRTFALASSLLALALVATVASAPAASSSVVVTMSVPSATSLDISACAMDDPDRTAFGTVVPGALAMTTLDCEVAFGSSNDTARLRMSQGDAAGVGMWAPTRGVRDTAFDGPSGSGNGAFLDTIGTGDDKWFDAHPLPDGGVLTAGACRGASDDDFCLGRYTATGARDSSFDGPSGTGNGVFIDPIGASQDIGNAMAVQPDGRIVVAGACHVVVLRPCLARYLPDGSRDVTFDGPTGTANGAFIESSIPGQFSRVRVLDDGRIVATGSCNTGICLARYLPDGARDTAFDGPGGHRRRLLHRHDRRSQRRGERTRRGRTRKDHRHGSVSHRWDRPAVPRSLPRRWHS